jgi:hypothetical protein
VACPSVLSPVLALGQTAQLPAYTAKLVSQRDCSEASGAPSRRTRRNWAVELEITNTSAARLPVNPFFATLQDDQKHSYVTSLTGCPSILPARLLEPKESVRGYVPYDLPFSTHAITLAYGPTLRAEAQQIARFRLEP